MSRTRDWRRAQKDRYLSKSRFFYKEVAGFNVTEKTIHRRAETRCPCSAQCCGNPRKFFNAPTIQEVKFFCSSADDLFDAGVNLGKEKNDPNY